SAFTRTLELCESIGDSSEIFFALFGLYAYYHVRGAFRIGRDRIQQLARQAESGGDHTQLILAYYGMGQTLFHTGEFQLARQHQAKVLSLYDRERDWPLAFQFGVDAKVGILSYAGSTLWYLGYPDQALAACKEAIAFAKEISHPNSFACAEHFLN